MKRSLLTFSLLGMVCASIAQNGWNWPEDGALLEAAKEKQAFYKVSMQLDNWSDAYVSLQWLYINNPNLNPSIYIDGAKVITQLMKTESDNERTNRLEDSLLLTYDKRVQYFGDEAKTLDRKAFEAFKLFYKDQSKFGLLTDLYDQAYKLIGNELSQFNYTPYMLLAKQYYQSKPDEFTANQVLEVHSRISEAIEYQMQNGGRIEKLKSDQDKIDAFLSSMDGVLSCDFIENKLVPKIKDNPNDIGTAKKIFKYSLQAKCSDAGYFLDAGAILLREDPTYNLAKALGDKHLGNNQYAKSIEFYNRALELTEDSQEKFDVLMKKATIYSKQEEKEKSRETAYQALSHKPDSKESYDLIGNLYFSSYDDCKMGDSKVTDRGVFLLAYDMYALAGNTKQMAAAKEQFPSIEEIFNENLEVNQNITVECWINKTTKVRRRD